MRMTGQDGSFEERPSPLMLTSIRLPAGLVRVLDEVAAAEGMNRSEIVRRAVTSYVRERRGGVGPSEAEHALEVLRRVVSNGQDPVDR